MTGAYNEVNVQPIDVCHALRQGIEFRFCLAPIVVRAPVANERLQLLRLDALRSVFDIFGSDQRVAAMRRRRSARDSSGTLTLKERMLS